jgi:hypothetical protein
VTPAHNVGAADWKRPLPAPGSLVRLSFSPVRLHCFDAQSGWRIGAADS